jgi:hypothetical protein
MRLPRLLAGTLSLAAAAHGAVTNSTADAQAADPQGDAAKYPPVCPSQVTVTKAAVTVTNTYTPPGVTVTKPAVTITNTYTPPGVTITKPAVTVTFTQPAGSYVKSTVTVTDTVTKPGGSVTVTTTRTADGGYGGTT